MVYGYAITALRHAGKQMSFGQFNAGTDSTDSNALVFLIQQTLLLMQTVTLVKVVAVHGGGIVPVGTVDVQPMVNQMDAGPNGTQTANPHAIIYGVPFFRLQGGINAIVCDPQPGDIGMCAFASRDISSVKSTKAVANPGSRRVYDWSDGLYIGGFLNVTPTAYLEFAADGTVTLKSPTAVNVQAPQVTVNSPAVTLGSATTIDGVVFLEHTHSGVQTGGGVSGPVVP